MDLWIWAFIGYVAGTFPSTVVVARITGRRAVLDAVERSVGELDAHVLLQRSNGRAAALAATMDVLKGLVPVVVAARLTDPYSVAGAAIGAVVGHCWPMWYYRFAGRGLAAGAGAFLGFLPIEMVAAGLVRVGGSMINAGGLSSTLGYVAIPVLAWWRGQPAPYIVAAVVINVLISARRLEGLSADIDAGVSPTKAVTKRIVLDASSAPADT